MVERLLVQSVLEVDVGLGEQAADRRRGRRRCRRRRRDRRGRERWRNRSHRSGRPWTRACTRGGGRGRPSSGRASHRRRSSRRRGGDPLPVGHGQLLGRLGIVGKEVEDHSPGQRRLVATTALGVDVGQRPVHGDGLRHLPQVAEGLGHEPQRIDILLVGAVARLELPQGLLGVSAGQVFLGQLSGELQVVGREQEDPLGELQMLVAALVLAQMGRGAPVELEGLGGPARLGVEVAEPLAGDDVLRVEIEEPPEHVEVAPLVAGLLMGGGHGLELIGGVVQEPELLVEPGQLLVHPDVVGGELDDLLEDGHRLQEEALVAVDLGDLVEGRGRGGVVALLLLDLADLQEDANLLAILGEDLVVGLQGLVVLALLDEPGGLGDDLVLVDRHRADQISSWTTRPRPSWAQDRTYSGAAGA